MYKLFLNTMPVAAMRQLFAVAAKRDHLGNAEPLPAIFPKGTAPTVALNDDGEQALWNTHWGFLLPQVSKKTGKPIQPKVIRRSIAALLLTAGTAYADYIPDCGLYTYAAEIVRVIDRDTVVANIDLGFNTGLHNEHLRLFEIETPERGADGYDQATEGLRNRIDGQHVYMCTVPMVRSEREARGSFGRYLAIIYFEGENINEWMLSEGLAQSYE